MDENTFYNGIYRNVQDAGLSGWYVRKSHKMLEAGTPNFDGAEILEVGGNVGEHISFVSDNFKSYLLSDYRETGTSFTDSRITFSVQDVQALDLESDKFDRTIATCLLHHLPSPLSALSEMSRVTRIGGTISILVPCDPGWLYRMAKKIGPNRTWKKNGIVNPDFFHYTQHPNHFPFLNAAIIEVFKSDQVTITYWPAKLRSWNLNMFAVYQIRKNVSTAHKFESSSLNGNK